MPQAAHQEGDKEVDAGPAEAPAVPAQRAIYIGAQRPPQRDVPPAPELRDALRFVGAAEVHRNVDVEHLAQADRHVRVAREVEKDLQGIADRRDPPRGHADLRHPEARVREEGEGVGDGGLLEQAHREQVDPRREVVRVEVPPALVLKLRDHLRVQHDRPRHQLRKEAHEQAVVPQLSDPLLSLVHRHQERQLLKREEADPQRQQDVLQREAASEHGVDVLHEEVVVFVVPDQPDVEQDAEHEKELSFPSRRLLHARREHIVHRDRRQDQRQVPHVIVAIKKQRRRNQEQPLYEAVLEFGQQVVAAHHHRQKREDKNVRRKNHTLSLMTSSPAPRGMMVVFLLFSEILVHRVFSHRRKKSPCVPPRSGGTQNLLFLPEILVIRILPHRR